MAGELQVKICLNTYKLFYLVNTEDTLVRGKTSRAIKTKRLDYNRAARKADGSKWTQYGYVTKEEQNAAEAAAEIREQQIVPHPASAHDDVQPSTTPVPTDVPRSPEASILPAVSDDPVPSDGKVESPPAPVEDEAMDVEISDPAPVVPEPLEPVSVSDDVEMPDA
jgi:hypothetical protein